MKDGDEVRVAWSERTVNERVRIAVRYGDQWKPMIWFSVGADASIYLGIRKKASLLRRGVFTTREASTTIAYTDGDMVTDSASIADPHISIHGSGRVNMPGGGLKIASVRDMEQQRHLGLLVLEHPNGFAGTATLRKSDVGLHYPFDEHRPVQWALFCAPRDKFVAAIDTNAEVQANLAFAYPQPPGIVLQFVLSHGVQGPWPPASYCMLWRFDPD